MLFDIVSAYLAWSPNKATTKGQECLGISVAGNTGKPRYE